MRIIVTFPEIAAATSESAAYAAVFQAMGLEQAAVAVGRPAMEIWEELASSKPDYVRIDHNQQVLVISIPPDLIIKTSGRFSAFLEANVGLFASLAGLVRAFVAGIKTLHKDVKDIWGM